MKILSIHGGGIRGIIPAFLLTQFESVFGSVYKNFDLIVGTSTGAIIGSGLANGLSAKELFTIYDSKANNIFKKSIKSKLTFGFFDEKYNIKNLENELKVYIENKKLSDSLTRLLITAYDIQRCENIIFDSSLAKQNPNFDFALTDCIKGSCAAPTYFEPVQISNLNKSEFYTLIDGGLGAMNNATLLGVCAALRLGVPLSKIKVLEVGTGFYEVPLSYAKCKDWGFASWAKPIIDIIFDGADNYTRYLSDTLLNSENYVRIQRKITNSKNAQFDNVSRENISELKIIANTLTGVEIGRIGNFLKD